MKLKSYYKRTPIKYRKIGDSILISSTSLAAIMMTAPIEESKQVWIVFILNIIGVIGKVITNFFTENETIQEDSQPGNDSGS